MSRVDRRGWSIKSYQKITQMKGSLDEREETVDAELRDRETCRMDIVGKVEGKQSCCS